MKRLQAIHYEILIKVFRETQLWTRNCPSPQNLGVPWRPRKYFPDAAAGGQSAIKKYTRAAHYLAASGLLALHVPGRRTIGARITDAGIEALRVESARRAAERETEGVLNAPS
ncbi:MAG: hypothetical protein SH850_14620 [Planctomycetaceae bacterium]|nr:hypothetical protein [Planctomycetaceae bacterium]